MTDQTPRWLCEEMAARVPSAVCTVLEPTPGKGNLKRALSNYKLTTPKEFFDCEGHWDCIVMNPPFYEGTLCGDILTRCLELSDHIIALLPWQFISSSERRLRKLEEFGLRRLTRLPRTTFESGVQVCLLQLHKDHVGGATFDLLWEPVV